MRLRRVRGGAPCRLSDNSGCGGAERRLRRAGRPRTIRIVVPFPAGGLNDIVARLIGPVLQDTFKETVIVDNRPGASGSLGTNAVVTAKDGHTLLMVASATLLRRQQATCPTTLNAISCPSRWWLRTRCCS